MKMHVATRDVGMTNAFYAMSGSCIVNPSDAGYPVWGRRVETGAKTRTDIQTTFRQLMFE